MVTFMVVSDQNILLNSIVMEKKGRIMLKLILMESSGPVMKPERLRCVRQIHINNKILVFNGCVGYWCRVIFYA